MRIAYKYFDGIYFPIILVTPPRTKPGPFPPNSSCQLHISSSPLCYSNLPIRYLIISNIYQGRERIRTRDFQNLIGRAGRAGIYTEGTVLLSEIRIYNKKSDPYNWRWGNYKKLLSSDSAEACTSALFTWLRADEGMEKYLENIIEIFVKYYANGDFSEKIKIYLEIGRAHV